MMAYCQEESIYIQVVFALVFLPRTIGQMHALEPVLTIESGGCVLKENLYVGRLHHALLHDLAGSEIGFTHYHIHL